MAGPTLFAFDNSYVRDLPGLYEPWAPAPPPAPRLVILNDDLAEELGVTPEALRRPEGVAVLAGGAIAAGSVPVAQAYAGHQFGVYSPRLGDGRAVLLGEVVDQEGRRRDVHLKGSGRTPFARGGDGKAALGPMLREHLLGEAMHALGIPTTRALAVLETGERVARDGPLPGAVMARVAASHLRVGTFQYAAATGDVKLLGRLVDHAVARHHPQAAEADCRPLALLEAVLEVQASLVAQWMLVGFVHGVLNTDNTTISGETIDYGPCAFMDAYHPATSFSSIDHGGRYAYGNQPPILQWNLARLAEALLPLIDGDAEAAVADATSVLRSFPDRYRTQWSAGTRRKLGLHGAQPGDDDLVGDLLGVMEAQAVDFTSTFRALSQAVGGDLGPVRGRFSEPAAFDAWAARWRQRRADDPRGPAAVTRSMDDVNPVYVPRNHLVEEALAAATAGDMGPYGALLAAVGRPFEERPGLERFAEPAPGDFGVGYQTFCGT